MIPKGLYIYKLTGGAKKAFSSSPSIQLELSGPTEMNKNMGEENKEDYGPKAANEEQKSTV